MTSPEIAPPTSKPQRLGKYIAAALICVAVFFRFWIATHNPMQQAGDLMRHKQYDSAIALIGPLIEKNPANIDALTMRGAAYTEKEMYREALQDYNAVLVLDPDNFRALDLRCGLHILMDTYEDAIKDCTRSLEIQSAGHAAVSAYLTRGIAYDALRKADLALRDMGEAIALDSSNGFLFAVRGETYANAGHREEAAKDLAHAAQLNPDQAGLVLARGMFTAVGGGYADAIPDLTKAMQEEKPDPMAAIWLHIAKFHAGQNDAQQQIEQDYRKTDIRQWPGAVAALYAEKATTEDVKTQASSGDPSIWGEQKCEADFYLGEYALIKNDKEGATKSFRAAVDGCPQTVSNEKQSAAAELKALQPQLISQPPQNP